MRPYFQKHLEDSITEFDTRKDKLLKEQRTNDILIVTLYGEVDVYDVSTKEKLKNVLLKLWEDLGYLFNYWRDKPTPPKELSDGLTVDTVITDLPEWQRVGAVKAISDYKSRVIDFEHRKRMYNSVTRAESGDIDSIQRLFYYHDEDDFTIEFTKIIEIVE